ncbi:MAG: ABC transporter permease [Dehalococcoidia bacterium]
MQQERALTLAAPARMRRGFWTDALVRLMRNRLALAGGTIILLLVLSAIFAPWVAPKGYAEASLEDNYATPGAKYLLGADFLGRDLLSRIIYGTRVSLTVGVVGATTATLIGIIYGSVSGYYGGRLDSWMMRFVDLMYALPTLLVIILLMVFFRSTALFGEQLNIFARTIFNLDRAMGGVFFIFIGIAITSWMTMARLVRGSILALKETEFVEAARTTGAGDIRIMVRHLLPNFLGPVIVAETLNIPHYILYEAFLSFIGLGVNAPTPSWGGMISEGVNGMRSFPHLVLFPAAALSITLLAFNFLGDGLRDALDPRMRH